MEYKNKIWLEDKYLKEKLNIYQIAKTTNNHPRTIHSWLVKFNIPRRKGGVRKWSEEQKEYRRNWNKAHPEINGMKGRHHSEETKIKMSETRKGKSNGNWRGGITKLLKSLRSSREMRQWKKIILERDNYTCQDCGNKDDLQVHHIKSIIDYPNLLFATKNGITLCIKCHLFTNRHKISKGA